MTAGKASPCPRSFLKETLKVSFKGPGSVTSCASRFAMTLSCMILCFPWNKHKTAQLLSWIILARNGKKNKYEPFRVKCKLSRDVDFGINLCSHASDLAPQTDLTESCHGQWCGSYLPQVELLSVPVLQVLCPIKAKGKSWIFYQELGVCMPKWKCN